MNGAGKNLASFFALICVILKCYDVNERFVETLQEMLKVT
jgi:hypothetical protein